MMTDFGDGLLAYTDIERNADKRSSEEKLERLRDEFAMAALTGCLAYSHLNPMSGNFQENGNIEKDCEHFYKYADQMLIAREIKNG